MLCCLKDVAEIWSLSSEATPTSQTQVAYLLLLIVSTFLQLCIIMCFKSLAAQTQTLKHTDPNEHKHSRNTNPLVHIRHTIFSSCFSSAFPNGWLNQLCGAWFKSSGMLSDCQLLDRQQGEKKVTGGEQLTSSSTFIKICLDQDESQINTADQAWEQQS